MTNVHERYMPRLGLELVTPGLQFWYATNCVTGPGKLSSELCDHVSLL